MFNARKSQILHYVSPLGKLALTNGLWISITPPMLPKLTMVKEALIAHYRCHAILVKLRYINKGGITCQHALKGNIINFVQNLESAIKLLEFPMKFGVLVSENFSLNPKLTEYPIQKCICNTFINTI